MSIQSKFLVTNITGNICSEKRYVKNLTACRGARGSGQIMSLKESAGAFFAPRLNCTGTKCYVCLFKILFTPGELHRPCGGDGVSFNMLHSCPVSARNQTPLLFLLSYLRLKRRKKNWQVSFPLGKQRSEMKKESGN